MSASTAERPVVCVFVRNPFRNDARVLRQSEAIAQEGFNVVVFATAVDADDVGETREGPLRVVRVRQDTVVSRFIRALGRFIRRYAAFRRALRRIPRRARYRIRRAHGLITYFARADRADARRELGVTPQRKVAATLALPLRPIFRAAASLPAGTAYVPFEQPPRAPRPAAWSVRRLRALRRWLRKVLGPLNVALQGLLYAKEAGRAAGALRPVVYHANDLNVMLAVRAARKIHAAPFIYDSHELWPHRNRPWTATKRAFATWSDRYWSRRADRVITVSASIARHMEKTYGITDVRLIRNVSSVAKSVPLADDRGLSGLERPLMLYVGRITTHRGVEQLIDALPLIPRGTLVLMGHGPESYQATLVERARSLGVAHRLHLAGSIPNPQLIDAIKRCDIGFSLGQNECLSYYMSLPNKMFEYVHAGIPIITSDFPEMGTFVRENDLGLACDSSDPAAIAETVEAMLASPDGMRRYSENCASIAPACSWEAERVTFVQIYRDLVPPDRWPAAPPPVTLDAAG